MTDTSYGLFDVDNHYYETEDALTRHLEPEYLDRIPEKSAPEVRLPGQENWVMRPGSLKEYLRKLKSGAGDEPYELMPQLPSYRNRDDRIKLMETGATYEVTRLGVFAPEMRDRKSLAAGEVGYLICAIKRLADAKVAALLLLVAIVVVLLLYFHYSVL